MNLEYILARQVAQRLPEKPEAEYVARSLLTCGFIKPTDSPAIAARIVQQAVGG